MRPVISPFIVPLTIKLSILPSAVSLKVGVGYRSAATELPYSSVKP